MTGRVRSARRLLWLVPALLAPAASAVDDADIYALIDTLRPVAEAIVVDGNPADWGAIPAFPDPSGDAMGDATRDITSVRIAPTSSALAILIQTAGAPSASDWAFWLEFDFTGEQFPDVVLGFAPGSPDFLAYYPAGGCTAPPPDYCTLSWIHSELAIGSAVEIRVPYGALDAALPASMQGKLTGASARSWVRAHPYTVDYPPPSFFYAEIDQGAAVGSFRLVTTPYALDPALPPGGDAYVALPNPLPGLWYVGQGAFNSGSHAGYWGYDLQQTDNALFASSPIDSTDVDDYFSFGQPILAPAAGTVFSVEKNFPDLPAGSYGNPGDANFLYLQIPGNLGLLFTHAKQGTIPFAPSDPVPAGALVGRVGNSGYSGYPHLHYELSDIDESFATVPLGLSDAHVGLNPTAVDPWRRDLATWGIREGFFVLPEPRAELVFAVGVALLALLSQLRRVRAVAAARARRSTPSCARSRPR